MILGKDSVCTTHPNVWDRTLSWILAPQKTCGNDLAAISH